MAQFALPAVTDYPSVDVPSAPVEDVGQTLAFSSKETAEAMLAFVQKRDPKFIGE